MNTKVTSRLAGCLPTFSVKACQICNAPKPNSRTAVSLSVTNRSAARATALAPPKPLVDNGSPK
ncbi:Uncharacterised protein [Mycobacteroides abscessus subsp. abscessus]|nr:Uncharacterised protein [Mycobacteroides abscessus subsp. abscessus]